ncbi:MAG: DUF4287 domain-containing protein [Hymenobacteraceae bacterium]|nr:DUF4287 domain-containing protein [Hymenobacteraceae bacterium]
MEQAEKTMIDNLYKNTGKTLEQWTELVRAKNFAKHGEIIKFLKEEHSFTHGFANLVAHKSKSSDAGSIEDKDALIEKQYKGKEHFRPLYDVLLSQVQQFGDDVEVAPKNSYVSLRRKKQFAILQPATKTRFEVGLNLKGQEPEGALEAIDKANAMCSHKIILTSQEQITPEVIDWIRTAYQHAG